MKARLRWINFFILLFLTMPIIQAQTSEGDTIVVQTFTYDSPGPCAW